MKTIPLTCPCPLKSDLLNQESCYLCLNPDCEHSRSGHGFPVVGSVPILISESRTDTVCSRETGRVYVKRSPRHWHGLKRLVVGESAETKANCTRFLERLTALAVRPKVLVIGGGEKGSGTEQLWSHKSIEIHSIDIYASDTVDVVCDGHYLPLKDDQYDGVWIQAVLEHVVEPFVVVNEIHRVLKPGGIVYAETPFMQQVHEGAYDFHRFTVLGHRYLFKRFQLIAMGGNKGPEVVFAWSVRYLVWALFRSRTLARIAGLSVGLLMRPLGKLVSARSLHDASSGVFFMGEKSHDQTVTHKELVSLYSGQF